MKALENSEPDADTEKEKWARWDKKMVAAQKELEQLRTKEEQLRTEKEQLRTEKEQLRTEKLLLLQQATPSAAPGLRPRLFLPLLCCSFYLWARCLSKAGQLPLLRCPAAWCQTTAVGRQPIRRSTRAVRTFWAT